jgi:hypothetical protein
MKKLGHLFLFLGLLSFCISTARADAYDAQPKLVIILVFDQFRGDYLDRYRAEFKARTAGTSFSNKEHTSRTATTITPTSLRRQVTPPSVPEPTPTAIRFH